MPRPPGPLEIRRRPHQRGMRTVHSRRASSVRSTRLEIRSARSKRSDTGVHLLVVELDLEIDVGMRHEGQQHGRRVRDAEGHGRRQADLAVQAGGLFGDFASTASPSSRIRAARSSAA